MRLVSRIAIGLAALTATSAVAQQVDFPRLSPNASVSQLVGITDIELHYSRPGVKGRAIWGGLVPYDQVWRTGANENTTIKFSTPVKVEGHELPAGTYGLQTIPTAGDWTLILSKDADQWGAFDYKPEHDALRATVKTRPGGRFEERMGFRFEDLADDSVTVVLAWEKLELPFRVEVDTKSLVAAKAKESIRWQTGYQAANWCIQNDTCLDDAQTWLDSSLALQQNFNNLRALALLRAKRGDVKGAVEAGEKALAAGKTAQNPPAPNLVSELEASIKDWKAKGKGK
jgi:hypothetical protein